MTSSVAAETFSAESSRAALASWWDCGASRIASSSGTTSSGATWPLSSVASSDRLTYPNQVTTAWQSPASPGTPAPGSGRSSPSVEVPDGTVSVSPVSSMGGSLDSLAEVSLVVGAGEPVACTVEEQAARDRPAVAARVRVASRRGVRMGTPSGSGPQVSGSLGEPSPSALGPDLGAARQAPQAPAGAWPWTATTPAAGDRNGGDTARTTDRRGTRCSPPGAISPAVGGVPP